MFLPLMLEFKRKNFEKSKENFRAFIGEHYCVYFKIITKIKLYSHKKLNILNIIHWTI
jgi:hypothetical protein